MATDDTKTKAGETAASKAGAEQNAAARDAEVEEREHPVDQAALGLSKHLTSWRDAYGDDVVDAAVELSTRQRQVTADDRAAAEKADAAQARLQGGQQRDAAPSGRSAADPKASAKT